MDFLRGYIWRYKVAETRLLEAVDNHGGGVELSVIIQDFLSTDYICRQYGKMHENGKLVKFLLRAIRRSKELGLIEYICINGGEIERKVFVFRAAESRKSR